MSWQGKEKEAAPLVQPMDLSLYPAGIQVVLVCHTKNLVPFTKISKLQCGKVVFLPTVYSNMKFDYFSLCSS